MTLSPDYSYRAIPLVESPLDGGFLLAVLVLVGLGITAVASRRTEPLVPFAVGWYALTLLPASNLFVPIGTIFGERLLYVPSVAFCILAGHLLVRGLLNFRPAIASVLLLGVMAALGLRTVTYAAVWTNNISLATAAARVVPNSSKVQGNLGNALLTKGRTEEAIKAYHRAVEILPTNIDAATNLAVAYRMVGRFEAAERTYRRVLETEPNNAFVLHGLGAIRHLQGNLAEAVEFWKKAIASNPKHAPSLGDLGNVYFLDGDFEKALVLYERAVAADPGLSTAWYNLGMVYERTGQWDRARAAWQRFLETVGDEDAALKAHARQKLRGAQ
jgi:tetratricopeptide (TPR) repeat protein